VLAEEKHFGRAANRLSLTQPALSSSVFRLEENLNVRLFDRDNKAVSLTSIGAAMLTRARELVLLSEKMEQYVRAVAAGRAGVVEVGFTGTMLYRGVAEILKEFSRSYPAVELSIRELTSQVQIGMLHAGSLDVGFLTMPVPPHGLSSFAFAEERFAACISREHPLAGDRELDVAQLRDEVFVMLARENSPTFYEYITALCTKAGFQPKSRIVAAQVPSVLALVASGLGVSLMPESIGAAQFAGVIFVPIRGEASHPSAYVAWNSERDVPGLQGFLDTVHDVRGRPRRAT
jgi:DNA-binding transcriptional LysR family regulator